MRGGRGAFFLGIRQHPGRRDDDPDHWWALIAACNLGGNPKPVGSIAAVIALHSLKKERGIRIGWGEYLKIGGLVTLLQVPLVIGYILCFRKFDLFPAL